MLDAKMCLRQINVNNVWFEKNILKWKILKMFKIIDYDKN
jgi:hypothetical protein